MRWAFFFRFDTEPGGRGGIATCFNEARTATVCLRATGSRQGAGMGCSESGWPGCGGWLPIWARRESPRVLGAWVGIYTHVPWMASFFSLFLLPLGVTMPRLDDSVFTAKETSYWKRSSTLNAASIHMVCQVYSLCPFRLELTCASHSNDRIPCPSQEYAINKRPSLLYAPFASLQHTFTTALVAKTWLSVRGGARSSR